MKLPIEVFKRMQGGMVIVRINGNDVAVLSDEQADELANKLLEVTCRITERTRLDAESQT